MNVDTSKPQVMRDNVATYALAIVVSAVGWWALLGWDTKKTTGSDGNLHGPYDTWQIVGLVVVLGLLAVWLSHRGTAVTSSAIAALTSAVCFGISAQFDSDNDGLWPIGAVLLAIGAFVGISLVASIARTIETRTAHRR